MTKSRAAKKAARAARTTGDRQYARTRRAGQAIQPPAGVPKSRDAEGSGLDAADIPVLIFPVVRAGQAPLKVAQSMADACSFLVREGEGWYRAAANLWVIPLQPGPEPPPGLSTLSMLLSVRTRRAWREGATVNQQEIQEVISDVVRAITAVLRARHGAPADAVPELLPIGADKARTIATQAGEQARAQSTGVHPSLADAPEIRQHPEQAQLPDRVVDRENQGWHQSAGGRFEADFGTARGLSDLDYPALLEQRGPLRPVVPCDPGDALLVRGALADAGVKAVASVLVALYQVSRQYAEAASAPGRRDGGTLLAGREGSWETHEMNLLAWEVGSDLADKPTRFDPTCVRELVDILHLWTGQRATYVEVAENLAFLVGQVADELGGWDTIADRYLRPGARIGHPEHVITRVRGYLLSRTHER